MIRSEREERDRMRLVATTPSPYVADLAMANVTGIDYLALPLWARAGWFVHVNPHTHEALAYVRDPLAYLTVLTLISDGWQRPAHMEN